MRSRPLIDARYSAALIAALLALSINSPGADHHAKSSELDPPQFDLGEISRCRPSSTERPPDHQLISATYLIGGPRPIVRVEPSYPSHAREHCRSGWATVEFLISDSGQVLDAKAIEANPSELFASAALRATSKWKFPPKKSGDDGNEIRLGCAVFLFIHPDDPIPKDACPNTPRALCSSFIRKQPDDAPTCIGKPPFHESWF